MRALIQRVSEAKVTIEGSIHGEIGQGILVLLGITHDDNSDDVSKLVHKIINLRVFSDSKGNMNISLLDIAGEILVISQFTLFANTKKGNRPSYIAAAKPQQANLLYEAFIREMKEKVVKTETGLFGADMKVHLINDGPVTILLDTKN